MVLCDRGGGRRSTDRPLTETEAKRSGSSPLLAEDLHTGTVHPQRRPLNNRAGSGAPEPRKGRGGVRSSPWITHRQVPPGDRAMAVTSHGPTEASARRGLRLRPLP